MAIKRISLNINGVDRYIEFDLEKDSLAAVLRRFGLTSVKVGCGKGVCGSCSVILNDKVIRSCSKKMKDVPEFSKIITLEGIGTPTHLHPLQEAWMQYGAAQCGFCSPGFIVSAYQLLKENPAPSRDEVRQWFHDHRNICRCTGYKPIVDAVMAAAKVMRGEADASSLHYDDKKDNGSIYNTHYPRPTALAKVTGLCDYGDDIKLKMPPDTLQLAMVQPKKYAHAKILGIDYSEAEKMPGVVRVITARDIKGVNDLGIPLQHKHARGNGFDCPVLNTDKIFNFGDVVALVAADTEEHARAAAAAVKVDLEPLPEYLNYLDAVAPDAMQIHPGVPNTFLYQPLYKGDKEPREVIEKSEYSVEGSFYTTREPHLPIEGDVVQAYFDEDGILTVQCKSQFLYSMLLGIPVAIGIPPEKFRAVLNPVGGSFGFTTSNRSFALAALGALVLERPVNLSYTYEEFIHHSGKRAPSYINGTLACDKDGKITAIEYDAGVDKGAYHDASFQLCERFVRFLGFPYNIPQARALARITYTNHAFGTAYRAYGSPQCIMTMESLADMLAEKVGLDPWEFRFRNVARPGDTMLSGSPYKEYPFEQLMLLAKPYYYEAVERARKESTPEKKRGVGISLGAYNCSNGGMDEAGCKMTLNADGTISIFNTWQDIGQGGDIGCLVHACEALKPLGIKPEQIRLCFNDTKTCPNSGLSGASRSHYMNGNAIIVTANKMMDTMRKADGSYRTYDEMVAEGLPTEFSEVYDLGHMNLKATSPDDGSGDSSPTYMYAVFVSEVEVDAATGKTKVLSLRCIDDVGVIGNYLAVDGQAYGGMSHSIGFALQENYDDFKRHNNMAACGIPTILDIPDDIFCTHVENPREFGPQGSAGCSEVFQSGGHAAIINAIKDATGVRIYELPASPDKVKAGMDAIARGEDPYKPEKYYLGEDMYDVLEELKGE